MFRLCLLLLGLVPLGSALGQGRDQLAAGLAARVARAPATGVGVYYKSLSRPDSLLLGANLRFHAASTMKVPVMIQIFRDADAGLVGLDDSLPVHASFPSLVDGSPFEVSRDDDSDSTLYRRVGRNASVRELLELMITRSSNLATNILIERVGAPRAQASSRALGAWSIQVLRGVEDGKAYRAGLNNTTTARDLGALLAAIAGHRAASPASCDTMLAILGRQEFHEGIPAGVPAGTRVAHKTGWVGALVYHDAAVVYPPSGGSYVLVVLTGGVKEDSVAYNLVADVSRLVYAAGRSVPGNRRLRRQAMSGVRVLVGTRKGAFVLTSDGKRTKWDIQGPHFAGWEMYHVKGSPADPNRLYASQSSGWFGQQIQRSSDGGKTWEPVGKDFVYDGVTGTHQWYDGTPHPWEFKRVWHLEPSLTDPDSVYAGVEDAALFRSSDGGKSWEELAGLRCHGSGPKWQPGAGGMCLHTIILDPSNASRMYIAISAAGAFRSDDGGKAWRPINRGLHSQYIPDPTAEVGHCVHRIALHRSRPNVLFMQKHWDVMRSDDAGDSWREVSGNLPTDFGFVIDVHAHEPDTIYVVPIKSDSEHFVPDGKLRVYRSNSGGNEWQALSKGLPQRDCYVNVLRDAMTVDALDPCGVYFGTTGGQVYASADAGDSWTPIVRDLPAVLSVEVQTLR